MPFNLKIRNLFCATCGRKKRSSNGENCLNCANMKKRGNYNKTKWTLSKNIIRENMEGWLAVSSP